MSAERRGLARASTGDTTISTFRSAYIVHNRGCLLLLFTQEICKLFYCRTVTLTAVPLANNGVVCSLRFSCAERVQHCSIVVGVRLHGSESSTKCQERESARGE